jgi:hypothetical protein
VGDVLSAPQPAIWIGRNWAGRLPLVGNCGSNAGMHVVQQLRTKAAALWVRNPIDSDEKYVVGKE